LPATLAVRDESGPGDRRVPAGGTGPLSDALLDWREA
jgi:hypothetical protein